jgi:hypothetical protein
LCRKVHVNCFNCKLPIILCCGAGATKSDCFLIILQILTACQIKSILISSWLSGIKNQRLFYRQVFSSGIQRKNSFITFPRVKKNLVYINYNSHFPYLTSTAKKKRGIILTVYLYFILFVYLNSF